MKSYTANPEAIFGYAPLTDQSGTRHFKIRKLRVAKRDRLVVGVAGVSTRSEAETLVGLELFVQRSQLPPPAEEEFYHDDLIDLQVETVDGFVKGRVTAVLNYGAGDILELAVAGGTELIPFTRMFVVEVDFARGRILIVPPKFEGQ